MSEGDQIETKEILYYPAPVSSVRGPTAVF